MVHNQYHRIPQLWVSHGRELQLNHNEIMSGFDHDKFHILHDPTRTPSRLLTLNPFQTTHSSTQSNHFLGTPPLEQKPQNTYCLFCVNPNGITMTATTITSTKCATHSILTPLTPPASTNTTYIPKTHHQTTNLPSLSSPVSSFQSFHGKYLLGHPLQK